MTQQAVAVAGRARGPAARTLRRTLVGLSAWLLAAALTGCAAAPPAPTMVEVAVLPAADLNPDANGRPSPVAMRLYQLASTASFEAADFFQLYKNEAATLGADLLGRDDLMVLPGQPQTLRREMKPGAHFLGVMVLYRSYDHADWRATAPVPPNQTTKLSAALGALSVSLGPAEAQP